MEKKMNIVKINNIKYDVDANRRRFDNWEQVKDTRKVNISNRTTNYTDINIVDENTLLQSQIKQV